METLPASAATSYSAPLGGGSVVKNLPVMQEIQETWVQSLSREDPLEAENPTGRGASQPPPTP